MYYLKKFRTSDEINASILREYQILLQTWHLEILSFADLFVLSKTI